MDGNGLLRGRGSVIGGKLVDVGVRSLEDGNVFIVVDAMELAAQAIGRDFAFAVGWVWIAFFLPGEMDVVGAAGFFMERFEVVGLACLEVDVGGGLGRRP